MMQPSKNGGAASPVCEGKEGASAEVELSQKDKEVLPFCKDCKPVPWAWRSINPGVFVDRNGLAWQCSKPLFCPHAIVMNRLLLSCRVRTAQLNEQEAALL